MRIFVPATNVEITESPATEGKPIPEVAKVLAKMGYPECATGTVRETKRGEDTVIEWLPQVGKKG
jgi:hypothetical protein